MAIRVRIRSVLERRARDVRALRRARRRAEDGFILLESVVAISLITVILAALAGFTLNSVKVTSELRARQGAAQLATSAMASLAAVPATDLVTGRDATGVLDQFTPATLLTDLTHVPASVQPWLTGMTPAIDPTALPGAGVNAVVSTVALVQTLNNISYSVETYLGSCKVQGASSTDCVVGGAGITHLRAVVSVVWKGRGCTAPSCSYATATLVNADADPVFNTNRATPPVRPAVDDPGNQVTTVGASVGLQLTVANNTGVPPFTWQVSSGTLPVGLSLSASGLISGPPTVATAATPLTFTVADAFGRTGSVTFSWTVLAAPTITTPAAQSTLQSQTVNLAIASTCPHTPCVYTLANAPAGLSINANTGVITGAPTTAGTSSNVKVTVTDADAIAATTAAFTWTVLPANTIGSPGTRGMTIGQVDSVAIAYTCPSTPCTISLTGTVPGLGLSTTSSNTTNNTTTSLSVSSTSGTVYVAGTVQTSAVTSGISKVYAPTVTITKGAATVSATGSWTAYTRPTIGAVGDRTVTVGATKNIALAYTCSYTPCTITLANPVPGLGLSLTSGVTTTNNTTSLSVSGTSGTVYVNGKVGSGAVPSGTSKAYATSVTITDTDGAAAASAGTWTAVIAPKITNPGGQAAEPSQNVAVQMAAACLNGGCQWSAAAQVGTDPTWYPLTISSTGNITYSNAPAGDYAIRVTVVDSDGISDTVTFALTVQTFTLTIPNQTTAKPTSGTKTVTLDVSALIRPLASGYTYVLTGQPGWLTISGGVLTATLTSSSATDTSITVTVTSTSSPTSNVASTFRWDIT